MKKRHPQDWSPEEFDSVVKMIQGDPDLREDIEAITGQQLAGKSNRQLFDLFRTIDEAASVSATVARYGQARQALRQTRAQLSQPVEIEPSAAAHITNLETRLEEQKALIERLKASNEALRSGKVTPIAGRVIKGEVAQ